MHLLCPAVNYEKEWITLWTDNTKLIIKQVKQRLSIYTTALKNMY